MKENKFRVWDEQTEEFMFFGIVNNLSELIEDGCFNEKYLLENSEQYTGLKDKNGKEIYEGDVIETYDRGNMFDDGLLPCTFVVVMKYAKWYPQPLNVKGLRDFKFDGYEYKNEDNEDCEVIGTIHKET